MVVLQDDNEEYEEGGDEGGEEVRVGMEGHSAIACCNSLDWLGN